MDAPPRLHLPKGLELRAAMSRANHVPHPPHIDDVITVAILSPYIFVDVADETGFSAGDVAGMLA